MNEKHAIVEDDYFGTIVQDPYRWLEDDNADDVKAWVQRQRSRTETYLAGIPFRQTIKKRLEEVWNYEKRGGFFQLGDYYYFLRSEGLQNQSVLCRQKISDTADAEFEVFFDPNTLSEDGTVALKNFRFSKDGSKMLYSVSKSGSDWEEVYVFDVATKTLDADHISWLKFSDLAWYKDGFFYSAYDPVDEKKALSTKNEFQKVYYHRLGTEQQDDRIVFRDDSNPLHTFYPRTSSDEDVLFIYANKAAAEGSVLFICDLEKGVPQSQEDFVQYNSSFDDSVHPIDVLGDEIFIITNKNAPFYKVVKTTKQAPSEHKSEEVLPEQAYLLEDCALCACSKDNESEGTIIAVYLKDVQNIAFSYDLNGKNESRLSLPKNGSIILSGAKKSQSTVFFTLTSYTVPTRVVRYDCTSRRLHDFFNSNFAINTDDYKSEHVFFESKDGTKIPMYIVCKKDIVLDGSNPTILYGYGGFAVSIPPSFSAARFAFLEQGGIFACANLRGGLEYGEKWHEAAKKMNKQNVFDDFIAAAEYLIEHKYTSPKKLAIQGASNGGLLIGAVTNQRPDLFAVAIPQVGVMDMLRYQHFTIGWAWVDEYGSSEDSKEMFDYLYAYSPVHNVKADCEYPAILITTGDHDDRVVPAHSFKYAQSMFDKNTGTKPVLIRINEKAGHGAGKPTAKIIEEIADMYAFVLYHTKDSRD